jgi:type I restriction enzyme S subunit
MPLGEFLNLKRGYDLPGSQREDGSVPVVSSAGLSGYHNEAKVAGPGVVTGRYGTLGELFYVFEDFWPLNTALYVQDFKGNDRRFIAYFLRGALKGTTSDKAAVPGVNRNDLHARVVRVPRDVSTQRRIASILSAYDDLIQNNRRRIQLLEQAARLLYKEWFVHLRFPGHEHAKITNGVPEGWEDVVLASIITIKHGFAFKGEFFSDAETSRVLLTPGNVKIGGGLKIDKVKYYAEDAPLPEDYILAPGDLVVSMTDLSKASDTLGFAFLVPKLGKLQFLHNQRLGLIEPVDGVPYFRHFMDQMFRDVRYRGMVKGSATGVSVKHTSPSKILTYRQPLPPFRRHGVLQLFDEMVGKMNDQSEKLLQMNEQLTKARDLLLPRLMNGEIPL